MTYFVIENGPHNIRDWYTPMNKLTENLVELNMVCVPCHLVNMSGSFPLPVSAKSPSNISLTQSLGTLGQLLKISPFSALSGAEVQGKT